MESVNDGTWTQRSVFVGRVITITAALAAVVALVLVERLGTTYEDGLAVTEESALLVSDAVGPVKALAGDLSTLAAELAAGLEATRGLAATTGSTLDSVGEASSANLAESAEAAAAVADDLAGVLETIERLIPGDTESVAEELRAFADGLEPVADQLRTLGGQLQAGATQLEEADTTLADLAAGMTSVSSGIQELGPAVDELEVTAEQLAERAGQATDRVELDRWLVRVFVILLGAALAFTGVAVERVARRLGDSQVTRSERRPD